MNFNQRNFLLICISALISIFNYLFSFLLFYIFYLFTFHASGWCDSMNGLAGTLLLGGLGIARTMESKFGSCCFSWNKAL